MQSKNYNMITKSIDTGLNRVQVGTAGGYIRLLDAPASANVLIHLNEQNADGIPLKVYHAIESTHIEKIYVSCNAVAGATITIVQANSSKDFKMVTPASDVALSSLGSYDATALSQLDKIMNPYQAPLTKSGSTNSSSQISILSYIANCDKVNINLDLTLQSDVSQIGNNVGITVLVDGINVLTLFSNYTYKMWQSNNFISLENIRGKAIEIIAKVATSTNTASYFIQEFTLKP